MSEPLPVGAVAYTPNVVTIWERMRDYFATTCARDHVAGPHRAVVGEPARDELGQPRPSPDPRDERAGRQWVPPRLDGYTSLFEAVEEQGISARW